MARQGLIQKSHWVHWGFSVNNAGLLQFAKLCVIQGVFVLNPPFNTEHGLPYWSSNY